MCENACTVVQDVPRYRELALAALDNLVELGRDRAARANIFRVLYANEIVRITLETRSQRRLAVNKCCAACHLEKWQGETDKTRIKICKSFYSNRNTFNGL